MKGKLTPLMEQYWGVKKDHEDKVVLFRMGDFFEMFHQDAETAAPILNIALTQRNKKGGDETKMCGVPHHSIAGPISKLLAAGYKVAICDQVEDPKEAKGLVKRAVTRILTPGLVYDPDTLDQLSANYLCSFDDDSISFLEPTTGEAFYYRLGDVSLRLRLLYLQSPVELVLGEREKKWWLEQEKGNLSPHLSWFEEALEAPLLPLSARRLLSYLEKMQGEEALKSLSTFEERRLQQCLEISPTVQRHLELDETYKGEKRGSFFHAINRTQTWAGARLLRNWLHFPLTDTGKIEERWNSVEFWCQHPQELQTLRKEMAQLGDIERRLGKLSNPNCNGRDLLALSQSLQCGLNLSAYLERPEPELLSHAQEIVKDIEKKIMEEPPLTVREGGLIRRGVDSRLDEFITLSQDSQKLLMEMEASEKEKTGISSLKIRYNNVFGFYIEITKTHSHKAPKEYYRKQTLTNAERFTTDELNRLEEKVLSARSKRSELEHEIFTQLKAEILNSVPDLLRLAHQWSELDVLTSLAWLAIEQKYCRPQWSSTGGLFLKESRHPVVEQERMKEFVPNDIHLDEKNCLLLTGPNMAGKSTLMRQVALTVILAQMGSFVPASQAELPLVDRLFTRIGASDHLNEGLSTFMVEMKETAEILKWASPQSLVIMDEIGRGTSTYDGMSLAQAILEYLVSQVGALSLFATHYHELTRLSQKWPQIKNAHMAIQDKGGNIRFLHLLREGPANRSYGVHVAKLAGIPGEVTQRARQILSRLEVQTESSVQQMSLLESMDFQESSEEASISPSQQEVFQQLKELSIQELTPLEALNRIAQWQQHLS